MYEPAIEITAIDNETGERRVWGEVVRGVFEGTASAAAFTVSLEHHDSAGILSTDGVADVTEG